MHERPNRKPLSHADSPNFEPGEVEQSRDVVRNLIQHGIPAAKS